MQAVWREDSECANVQAVQERGLQGVSEGVLEVQSLLRIRTGEDRDWNLQVLHRVLQPVLVLALRQVPLRLQSVNKLTH